MESRSFATKTSYFEGALRETFDEEVSGHYVRRITYVNNRTVQQSIAACTGGREFRQNGRLFELLHYFLEALLTSFGHLRNM